MDATGDFLDYALVQIMAIVGRNADTDAVCANVSHVSMESMHSAFSAACEGRRGVSCTLAVSGGEKRLTISVE